MILSKGPGRDKQYGEDQGRVRFSKEAMKGHRGIGSKKSPVFRVQKRNFLSSDPLIMALLLWCFFDQF